MLWAFHGLLRRKLLCCQSAGEALKKLICSDVRSFEKDADLF